MRHILTAVAALALASVAACSSSSRHTTGASTPPSAPPASSTTTALSGSVVLELDAFEDTTQHQSAADASRAGHLDAGDLCDGAGDYQGVTAGLTVAVTSNGRTVGQGTLGAGEVANYDDIAACEMTYDVEVPPNLGTYTIVVGSWATKTVTTSQLASAVDIQVGG
jgi:hypothetical protein